MKIPIYVISLERSVARREKIERQLKAFNMPFVIHSAVDGRELDLSQIADRMDDQHIWERGVELQAGEIGCFLSHEKLWQKIVAEKIPYAMILEDDAILSDDFADIVNSVPTINYRWDIVRLSATWSFNVIYSLCSIGQNRSLVRYGGVYGGSTAAYLISFEGAEILCRHCRKIRYAVDIMYDEPWKTRLHFWDVHPPAVCGAVEGSTLLSDVIEVRRNRSRQSLFGRLKKSARKRYVPLIRRLWNIFNPPIKN